jgi:uncharacterized protein YjeT (DUF2065 family)
MKAFIPRKGGLKGVPPCGVIERFAMKLLTLLLGLVLIVEGLPYVAAPEAMRNWLRKLSDIPPSQLRAMGFIAMASGLVICFVVQKTTFFFQ